MTGLETPNDVTSPERAKSDRAVFDAIRSKYKDAPRRDDSTTPSQTASSADAPHPDQSEAAPAQSQEPTSARKTAEEFLRLKAGVPPSAFESLSDLDVQQWAEERRMRESSVDGVFERVAATERELASLRTAAEAQAKPKGPTAKEALASASEKLADSLTEEERAALEQLIDLRVQPLKDELVQRDKSAQQERGRKTMRVVEKAREELTKRFGELATDKTYVDVFEDMERLEDGPRYGGSGRPLEEWMPELMVAVARSQGLKEQTDEVSAARQAAEEERLDRAAGGVQTGSHAKPATATSKEEDDRAVYDAVRKKYRQKRGAVG